MARQQMHHGVGIIAVLGIAVTAGMVCAGNAAAQTYEDTTLEDGYQMWHDGVFVLDVRTTGEFLLGHVPGAYQIPVAELADRLDEIADLLTTDILVHCKSGGRSATASQILADNGFTSVHNLLGGFDAWAAAGYESEAGDAGFDEISVENGHRLWESGALMLDCRALPVYLFGHVADAYNIPYNCVVERLAEILGWQADDIVVYCSSESCGLGATTCTTLAENGFERVHLMKGGYEAWCNAGYETEVGGNIPMPLACAGGTVSGPPSNGLRGDTLLLAAVALFLLWLPRRFPAKTPGRPA